MVIFHGFLYVYQRVIHLYRGLTLQTQGYMNHRGMILSQSWNG